jgi:Trp operon repressor
MPPKRQHTQTDSSTEVLKDLLITELAKADVPQREIRKIVGCDIHRVTRIARHVKTASEKP